MIDVTIGVLTRNSEATLGDALASVGSVAEIIVADGHSTDGTRSVARGYKAIVLDQNPEMLDSSGRLIDIAGAREQIVAAATNELILFLDSDELATPELMQEIQREAGNEEKVAAWRVPRKYTIDGNIVERAMNYPSHQLRLINRRGISGYDGLVHDVPVVSDGWTISEMVSCQLVPLPPLGVLWRRWHSYLRLEQHKKADLSLADWWNSEVKATLKILRWYAYRLYKSRRVGVGRLVPLSYELSRIAYVALVPVYTGRKFVGWPAGSIEDAWD